jgi:hypothetical protein
MINFAKTSLTVRDTLSSEPKRIKVLFAMHDHGYGNFGSYQMGVGTPWPLAHK